MTSLHDQSTQDGRTLETAGGAILRYGLVVILLWIGGSKFAAYEAEAIHGLVANSPLTSWGYHMMSVRGFSALIGTAEIVIAVMIASRRFAPRVSAVGSLGAVGMFLTTLSFILTTPGVWEPGYEFPFLSSLGGFLIKDILLLGAAVWTAGEALRAHALSDGRTMSKQPARVATADLPDRKVAVSRSHLMRAA